MHVCVTRPSIHDHTRMCSQSQFPGATHMYEAGCARQLALRYESKGNLHDVHSVVLSHVLDGLAYGLWPTTTR